MRGILRDLQLWMLRHARLVLLLLTQVGGKQLLLLLLLMHPSTLMACTLESTHYL